MYRMKKNKNIVLIFFGFLVLFFGVLGGLSRLGITGLPSGKNWNAMHGPLMVAGFLGIVISLERAVALDRLWGFFSPVFSIAGAVGLATGQISLQSAAIFFVIGNAILVGIFLHFLKKHFERNLILMTLGALFLMAGNVSLAFEHPIYSSVPLWVTFLVFTIVAERLELSSFLVRSKNQIRLLWALAALTGIFSFAFQENLFFGLAIFGLALWLIFNDIARKTIKKDGLARYSAACLLTGYVWLGVTGIFLSVMGAFLPGYYYDSAIHSFFLGFTMLMIFGHAPIIFPSILGVSSVYSPVFYIHFILMNLSLIVRIFGSLAGQADYKTLGGIGNSFSLVLFLLVTMPLVLKQVLRKGQSVRQ